MNIEDIKKIGDSVKEVSGLNIFDNTRSMFSIRSRQRKSNRSNR